MRGARDSLGVGAQWFGVCSWIHNRDSFRDALGFFKRPLDGCTVLRDFFGGFREVGVYEISSPPRRGGADHSG